VATQPRVGWLEVHPENFLANPHALELLTELSDTYLISLHTVGVSVGSAEGINRFHLESIRKLMERIRPVFISGHLAWSTHGNDYLNVFVYPQAWRDHVLWGSILIFLLTRGPGALSLDYIIERRFTKQ
jgi:uncharacterized protein (UPF0276 family)